MTTPKEALERIIQIYERNAGRQNEKLADIPLVARRALASFEGDAVERVALRRTVLDILNSVAPAVENLACNQEQADADGCMVKVSRQAVDEVLTAVNEVAIQAATATGLVAGEAAIRADWHTTGWDRARNSGRILLVWSEFAGVREHIELGWYSDSKAAWVNTYGHPFHGEPDGWAPLLPFKTAETIRADERVWQTTASSYLEGLQHGHAIATEKQDPSSLLEGSPAAFPEFHF